MAHPKYTVITFDRRGPKGMEQPAQGEWFYYEVGTNNTVTLTGYRAGIQADVERAIKAIIDRLNHDNSSVNPPESPASRLIFPVAVTNEDEEGNITDEEEPPTVQEIDE